MYIGFQHLHSFIAYILLAVFVFVIIHTAISRQQQKAFGRLNQKMALAGYVVAHLQLLVGLVLYFLSPVGLNNFTGSNMGNPEARLYMLEHPLMMLLAVTLVTIGYLRAKRAISDLGKYKNIVVFYTIGLLFVLSRIPWSNWL